MLINLRTPKYYSNLNENLSTIENYSSILELNWDDHLWDEIHEFSSEYNEYHKYLEYINVSLHFHLSNQLFDKNKLKELISLKGRLIKILNPKIQLVIYREPRENDRLYAYAIVDLFDENLKEIDVVEFIPANYEFFNKECFTQEGYYFNIKRKVFEFLKTTLMVPKDIDFEYQLLEIRNYKDYESRTNRALSILQKTIEDLNIDELEEEKPELFKQLLSVKRCSERVFKRLNNTTILDLTNK